MKYNPEKTGNHKGYLNRKSIRLKGYDYSQAGLYFITICCDGGICRFGNIENDEMILNEYGKITYDEWGKLTERFHNFELDVFQIMPNHIHGIIALNDIVGAGFTPAQNDSQTHIMAGETDETMAGAVVRAGASWAAAFRAGASPAPTVAGIVGAYKSLVAKGCLEIYKSNHVMAGLAPDQIPMSGKLWQRNYYEHIIRNEQSYQNISDYVMTNPAKWQEDKFHQ